MKKKHIVLGLATVPFLLANSPAPMLVPDTGTYDSFTSTALSLKEDSNDSIITTSVTNTGDKFIQMSSFEITSKRKFANATCLDSYRIIAPGETINLEFPNPDPLFSADLSVYTLSCDAFTDLEKIPFESYTIGSFEITNKTDESTTYSFPIDFTDVHPYGLAYTVKCDDRSLSFYSCPSYNSSEYFTVDKPFTTNNIQVTALYSIGVHYDRRSNYSTLSDTLLIIAIIIISVFFLIIFGPLIVGAVFLIRSIVRKAKRAG